MADQEKNMSRTTAPAPPQVKARKLKDFSDGTRATRITLNIVSVVCAVILWLTLSSDPSLSTFLAGPVQVWDALQEEIASNGRYFKDLSISLQRVLIGFSTGFICAIPVAFLMGWYPKVRNLLEPWIQFLRTIPPLAMIPLVILAAGLTEKAKYIIIFIASFLVVVVTVYQGIRQVDLTLVKAAYTFGAKDMNLFLDVMVPEAFPYILVGARLAVASSLTTLIAAEMTGTIYGLGARIQLAQQYMNTSLVLLGIITIGVIGYILDKVLLLLEARLTRWK
ncbi:ABC transporter permease [Intestinimonas massiliensis (ex Afouda et al. 2020)]|uniref:ABC transporter permease n=1 Tax=Intestinimonas massiliensis (ex Afouda et al. 2020) TaxID=1673721 RepID=UPI001A92F7C8|nr:ABC transporter permease [Intestinimonas massiliensis (ex Afouda et al. 2020)]